MQARRPRARSAPGSSVPIDAPGRPSESEASKSDKPAIRLAQALEAARQRIDFSEARRIQGANDPNTPPADWIAAALSVWDLCSEQKLHSPFDHPSIARLEPEAKKLVCDWLLQGSYRCKWAVAANPETPEAILRKLAKDHYQTRQFIALNPSTPDDVLLDLARDENYHVAIDAFRNRRLKTNPDLFIRMAGILAQKGINQRLVVAAKLETPPEVLTYLADSENYSKLLALVARHPACPTRALEIIERKLDHLANQLRWQDEVAAWRAVTERLAARASGDEPSPPESSVHASFILKSIGIMLPLELGPVRAEFP